MKMVCHDDKKAPRSAALARAEATAAIALLVVLVSIYISGLIVNLGNYFTLYPKNTPNWYTNYFASTITADSVFKFHQLPLWIPAFDGGRPYNEYPVYEPMGPANVLTWFLNENVAIKIYWGIFFLLGACSMYYLAYGVLGYTALGAVYAGLIFTMSGAFAYLFENGFYFCRELLLLPLLAAFFIQAQHDRRFLVLSAFILSLILLHGALFFPVTMLFIFLLSVFGIRGGDKRLVLFPRRQCKNFLYLCGLTFALSAFKIIPLLKQLSLNNRISGSNYLGAITQANDFGLFLRRMLVPENLGAGTMYIGLLPVIACIVGALMYYKEMKNFILILCLFIVLSFGPHSPVDLHRVLWNVPIFKSISEISKYYAVFIVFIIALLAGKAFSCLQGPGKRSIAVSLVFISVIGFSYLDLLKSNAGYFNIFNEKIEFKAHNKELYHVRGLNLHQGDESVTKSLIYFLYKKNVGFLGGKSDFSRSTSVVPKYFLLPKYAFLMPYTGLLVLPNPEYKSEAYFLDPLNSAHSIAISPNKIDLKIRMGQGNDRLVINQNFGSGWRANHGMIENYNGLLSLRFGSPVNGIVRLRYFPVNFYIGLAISLCAFIFCCYLLRAEKREYGES